MSENSLFYELKLLQPRLMLSDTIAPQASSTSLKQSSSLDSSLVETSSASTGNSFPRSRKNIEQRMEPCIAKKAMEEVEELPWVSWTAYCSKTALSSSRLLKRLFGINQSISTIKNRENEATAVSGKISNKQSTKNQSIRCENRKRDAEEKTKGANSKETMTGPFRFMNKLSPSSGATMLLEPDQNKQSLEELASKFSIDDRTRWESGVSLELVLRQKNIAIVFKARITLEYILLGKKVQPFLILEDQSGTSRRCLMLDSTPRVSISSDSLSILQEANIEPKSESIIIKLISNSVPFASVPIRNTEAKRLIFIFEEKIVRDSFVRIVTLLQTHSEIR